ncbi:MAG: ribbon-helix-helix protein, CopG family [Haloplanus sp.]
MDEGHLDMETVTVEFDEETLAALDDVAFADHRDNREAAIRDLLDEWVKARAAETEAETDADSDDPPRD